MTDTKRGRGRPKKTSPAEILECFDDFCVYIVNTGFVRLPTKTNFISYVRETGRLDIDRATFYRYLSDFCDTLKRDIDELVSDTLAEGAALGKYNSTMTIFCLKNWCGWSDGRQEISATVQQSAEVTASSQLLKALLEDNTERKGQ